MGELRVALIFPELTDSIDEFDKDFWLTDQVKKVLHLGQTNFTPPLSLLILAAVTPPNIEVIIIDERLEKINYDIEVDLVGITVVTRAAYHAYDIADKFRQRGINVVLGGIHPSVLPNEAVLHADSVVVGEGERVWPELLKDFRNGELQAIYEGGHNSPIVSLPPPRRNILPNPDRYLTTKVITATRGCSNSCTFCSIGFALGNHYRKQPVEKVIAELESIPGRYAIFLDDNLGCDIDYAKKLFTALIPLNIKWAGAISIPALEDNELIRLAARSGCISLGVGFESLVPKTLRAMGKHRTNNPDRFKEVIRKLHDNEIPILGYFILGYDPDTPETYVHLADFIEETGIEMPSINTLIPYPGSPIFRQFDRDGRILHKDWRLYDTAGGFVVYQPQNMSPSELVESYLTLTERIYSYKSVLSRLTRVGYFDMFSYAWTVHYNYQQKKSVAAERAMFENNFGDSNVEQ